MELDDELYAQITKHSDIGEHYFVEGKFRKALEEYKKALEYFEKLMTEYMEEENPFIRVRYGECLYETGKTEQGREHMLAAFKMEGTEVFDNDKYLKLISDLI